MIIDKLTRTAIVKVVESAIMQSQEIYSEEWISGKQLCEQIACFTPEWLKRYGKSLPRECIEIEVDGNTHKTGWCYPKKKILRLLSEGKLRNLKIE